MSDSGLKADSAKGLEQRSLEKSLARMEALLKQSAMGIHVLFQNQEIADAMRESRDNSDFFDFSKMKRVQDVMTQLINKNSYNEKLAFLRDLDPASHKMLIRTYFHIVENTVRANHDQQH